MASVLHFNRTSRLLWRLGLELYLVWTNYFGDFPCMAHSSQTTSTMHCAKSLFGLLGFGFAEDKLLPFEEKAETLGVAVDLSKCKAGQIFVDNKESRKVEITDAIDKLLTDGFAIPSQMPSLLGRMQFAEMQLSGRLGKMAMSDLRAMGHTSKLKVDISPEVRDALYCS